jgi:hypothetical protein
MFVPVSGKGMVEGSIDASHGRNRELTRQLASPTKSSERTPISSAMTGSEKGVR